MLAWCVHCKRFTEVVEDRCGECGRPLGGGRVNRLFLSEPCQGVGLRVDLEPGRRLLDRFTIDACLGRGSLGAVYLACDSLRSQKVALKVVPVTSEFAADQLQHEIELHAKVADHSHVIRVHDIHAAAHGGTILLLVSMEYANGGSFRQWLVQNQSNVQKRQSEGLCHFKQACRGVQALHDAGIVHRDLKPENLLFVQDVLKVSDLSLSRSMHQIEVGSCTQHQSQSEQAPGTPAYMSPEQFMAAHPDDVDLRSDIYSLGILLFELCHPRCRPPFGGSYEQLCERHLHMPAPRLENVEPDVARAVSRCLQKDPADRYRGISGLLDDLDGRLDGEVPETSDDAGQRQVAEQVEDLWDRACRLMTAGDLGGAGQSCGQILRLFPEHQDAKCMLEGIQGRSQKAQRFYSTIERGIGYQSLDELLALLAEAVAIYPNHPDGHLVQTQLLSIARQYRQVMNAGAVAVGVGNWQEALADFERARQLSPGSPAVLQLIEFVSQVRQYVETTRAQIDGALEQRNRRKALVLARSLDRYVERIRGLVHQAQR